MILKKAEKLPHVWPEGDGDCSRMIREKTMLLALEMEEVGHSLLI